MQVGPGRFARRHYYDIPSVLERFDTVTLSDSDDSTPSFGLGSSLVGHGPVGPSDSHIRLQNSDSTCFRICCLSNFFGLTSSSQEYFTSNNWRDGCSFWENRCRTACIPCRPSAQRLPDPQAFKFKKPTLFRKFKFFINIEILPRRYDPYVVAEIKSTSDQLSEKFDGQSFRILAKYIGVFGDPNNVAKQAMAMTAPVWQSVFDCAM